MVYKLLFDFGLVVLIWMTQLIVYPSFTMMDTADLHRWHATYTTRITIIVMPLMVGQLGLHVMGLIQQNNKLAIMALFLVLLAWGNTFFFAVPLHNQITAGKEIADSAQKLVSVNAWRTAFWTLVFMLDFYVFLKK